MRILLIRHGQSEANVLNVHEGQADFCLTARGHEQSNAMSEYIRETYNVSRIYHSPLTRAVETARHLADATGAPLVEEQNLMEFDNGLIAGMPFAEADERYPKQKVPVHASVYEQETRLAFRYRAEFVLSKLLSESEPGDTVAVVTHGGMIEELYMCFLGIPVGKRIGIHTGDTGIHEWLVIEDIRCVVRSNYMSHIH